MRYGHLHDGDHGHADITRIENRNSLGDPNVLHLDRVADLQSGDIDLDEIGQNRRQAGDLQIAFQMLKLAAVHNAHGNAGEMEGNIERQPVIHADFIKIRVIEPPADRFDLQLLDQGKFFQIFLSIDPKFDEDIFFFRSDNLAQFCRIHRKVNGLLTAAVKHGRDQSFLPETPCRPLAGLIADTGF